MDVIGNCLFLLSVVGIFYLLKRSKEFKPSAKDDIQNFADRIWLQEENQRLSEMAAKSEEATELANNNYQAYLTMKEAYEKLEKTYDELDALLTDTIQNGETCELELRKQMAINNELVMQNQFLEAAVKKWKSIATELK